MTQDTLTFGEALQCLKRGYRIARAGWNGKGMFLFIRHGSYPGDSPISTFVDGVSAELFETGDQNTDVRLPCICMHTASGSILHGWLASQTDILAEDWMVLEPSA